MGDIPQDNNTAQSVACRRGARRIAMPVEVKLETTGRIVSAVIRDVSFSEEPGLTYVGIGIHHNEAVPLDLPIGCRLVSQTSALPQKSHVTLMWTRRFGDDGFLSGGRMVGDPPEQSLGGEL